MQKTALKAFVYSFSVSLFAIMTANKVFCYDNPQEEPLTINKKNIVLFLKNNVSGKSPTKKIALSSLPEINNSAKRTPQPETEVILANALEDWEFPLEIVDDGTDVAATADPVVLADVLYAPDKPLEQPEIKEEVVYAPKKQEQVTVVAINEKSPDSAVVYTPPKEAVTPTPEATKAGDDTALLLARAEELDRIPLQKGNKNLVSQKSVKIGDPATLNHVALSDGNIPIESMKSELQNSVDKGKVQENTWKNMQDSPWVVARSSGGKNKLAQKEFANRSAKEISTALKTNTKRPEVQLASETVKNLIIPIPNDILQDENLTPKLAYPSTSEDAKKEKVIDAKIKQQEKLAKTEKTEEKELLSPIDEEVELDDIVATTPADESASALAETKEVSPTEKKKAPDSIVSALSSIFSKSVKEIDEAKERAKAKAQLKRSIKKRMAQNRPVSIMPTEIRLSFQPNRAEISGQTLRWVQAFASKAAETPDLALEIRIDGTSSTDLQQKRLNLLHNILTNKGVEYSKINTVFTSREPNSFILRTISLGDKGKTNEKINNRGKVQHIQW